MLLPALGKAREKARAIACVSNLRGCDTLLQMYQDDNSSFIPLYWVHRSRIYTSSTGNFYSWADACEEGGYLDTAAKIAHCVVDPPADGPRNGGDGESLMWVYGAYAGTNSTSGQGSPLNEKGPLYVVKDDISFRGLNLSQAKSPAKLSILIDGWSGGSQKQYFVYHRYSSSIHPIFRHGGRANFAMADGHVESMVPQEYYNLVYAGGDYKADYRSFNYFKQSKVLAGL